MTIIELLGILKSYSDIPQVVIDAVNKCIIKHQYITPTLPHSDIVRMKSNKGKIKEFYRLKVEAEKNKKEVFHLSLKDENDPDILLFMLLDKATSEVIYLIYRRYIS